MNINDLTATKIKALRSKLGLSAEAMAKDLGISKTAFSQLENAKVEITLSRIEMIANLYAVPLSDLIPNVSSNTQQHHGSGDNLNNVNTVNKFFDAKEERMEALLTELKELMKK